jgi:pimeloyl-ACP methyl ester carboxylesterase
MESNADVYRQLQRHIDNMPKQDRVLPAKHASIAESWIPNARVHLIDECGHCPQMEHPEEFNTQVPAFLNSKE